jgi:hypothetical protein
MALDILKKFIPGIREQGIDTDVAGTWSGTHTFSGTVAHTGATSFRATTGIRRAVTAGTDATYAPTSADSGMVYIATKSSSTQTYTLPSAATAGQTFTFICGHASGEILITPAASQSIVVTAFAAVGADADTGIVSPAAGTGIKNTAATNAIGDSVTLVSDGTTTWYGVGIASGIWASQ